MKYYRARLYRIKKKSQKYLEFYFKAPSVKAARTKVSTRYPEWECRGITPVGEPSALGGD